MRLQRVLLIGGLLTGVMLSGAASPASALTNAEKAKIVEAVKKRPPIEFLVVKGAPDACGRGCDSWIAAEGSVDADSAARLRQLFEKLGKLKLPIYFHSQGGNLSQGLAIGRMLRARGMTAGVARTLAAKCLPTKTLDECAGLVRAHAESEAVLRTDGARCVSACALAIFGATTREIAPDALLGVHSTFVYFADLPRGATQAQLDRANERGMHRLEKTFSSYIAEMKLGKELFNIIWNTKFEDMHYLTRAELFDLGIDRREPVETGWHFGYQPIPAVGSAAFVNLRGEGESAAENKKRMTLIASCDYQPRSFLLTSVQRLPSASARPTADLRINAGTLGLTLASGTSFLTTYKNETFEVRQQRVVRSGLEALMGATVIAIAERPQSAEGERSQTNEASTLQFPIPGTAASDALKTLVAHCTPVQVAARAISIPASVDKASLDVGEARDSGWRFAFLPVASIGSAAFAKAPWTRNQMLVAISCGGLGTYTISTVQRLPDSSATPKSDFLIGDASFGISLPVTASSLKMWRGDPYDIRQSKLPRPVVEKLLASSAIPVKETPRVVAVNSDGATTREGALAQFWMPTKGAQDAFNALGNQCVMLN